MFLRRVPIWTNRNKTGNLKRRKESGSLPQPGREMKKRRLVLFLLIGILSVGCSKDEIYYEGKSTSQWIKMLRAKDPEARRSAVAALGHIGPRAEMVVPALIKAMGDRDRVVRVQAIIALGAMPFVYIVLLLMVCLLKSLKREVR